jgi:hypothetical protein
MWAKKYGAEHEDQAYAVANDHNGFIYMTAKWEAILFFLILIL